MSTINIPDELYQQALVLANDRKVSVDEAVESAFRDYMRMWKRLKSRATKGSRDEFLAILNKAPDVEPEEFDRI